VDDAQHRGIVPEQSHGNRGSALAGGELEGAVVRVDEPQRILLGAGVQARLLAGKGAMDERLELLAQALLDLEVDRRIAAPAARPLGARSSPSASTAAITASSSSFNRKPWSAGP
jgi:hypothetical protein